MKDTAQEEVRLVNQKPVLNKSSELVAVNRPDVGCFFKCVYSQSCVDPSPAA